MGLFLLFLGLSEAYRRHHDRLMLREGLMVAFFLAGLVVLGGQQRWWLQDVLSRLDETTLFYGATALTAITDNAALTYLGSLVEGVSEDYKYSLVAGAVAGGGLTVIANAPNPAGFAILKDHFEDQSISALGLFAAALPPTLVAVACFRGIRGPVGGALRLGALGAVVRAAGPLVPVPADPAVRGRRGGPLGGICSEARSREVALGPCSGSRGIRLRRLPSAAACRRRTAPTPRPPW